jgi:hemerythrin-like domain-containing protein
MQTDRRGFLLTSIASGLTAIPPIGSVLSAGEEDMRHEKDKESEEEISAPEDLMREHGVLNRILLIYDEAVTRLSTGQDVPPEVIQKPATLARKFVEDYHERLEENFVFPRFEKKGTLVELVTVLRKQHDAGRRLTDRILRASSQQEFVKDGSRQELIHCCSAYVRMYRPHEAREDTVLFPTLYKIAGSQEVKELGEQFEEQEHRLFGEGGFDKTVDEVAAIEKQLGIHDLSQFTPK